MKPRITVVGSVNMDLVFRVPRMPAVGETLHGHEFRQIPGGKGANQAVAAARQGANVSFVGAVGDDGFGSTSRQGLADEGIELQHLATIPATATGVAGILVSDSGDNSIVLAAGANACVGVAQVEAAEAAIAAARYLLCQLETPLESVTAAIALARRHGSGVILNPAPAQPLEDSLLQQVDYLVVNETEAAQLSGLPVTDADSARLASQKLLQRGAGTVLLTMGGDGALITTPAGSALIPAVRVEVVDTTAAGDTFTGAFAVALANGQSATDAVREAQYAAALAVTKLGAQTSIPRRADVLALMAERQAAGAGA